ncbi:TPA: tail fiber assembly protein [Enterobacter roggenkampii]
MITLKNFSLYEPEHKLFEAKYLQTEDGLDWYYHMSRFQSDTLKVGYDGAGIIRMFSFQADLLYPLGLSVSEVEGASVPEGLNIYGEWMYADGKILPVPVDHVVLATQAKNQLLAEAAQAIDPLQDAFELGISTEREKASLIAWKKYRVELNRVDTSRAPDITWPEKPE